MARKIVRTNYRVEVYPRRPGDFGVMHIGNDDHSEEEAQRICDHIAECIKKHVGKLDDDRGDVHVVFDSESVCEHCGAIWTEAGADYNGGCCPEDEEPDTRATHAVGESQ